MVKATYLAARLIGLRVTFKQHFQGLAALYLDNLKNLKLLIFDNWRNSCDDSEILGFNQDLSIISRQMVYC